MSVPVQDPINQVVIVGGETLIPWTWNLQDENEITVLVQRALDGSIDTLTLNTDYTVDANDLDEDSGGNITPIGSESPVVTGDVWTLFRVTAIDRSPDFATSGNFFALTINEQLDELTRIAQDINRDSSEAVRKDPGVGDTLDRNIPQPVDRRALIFSDKGGGDFEMIMSSFDPDAAGDAEQSAAEAAQSASDAQDSADDAAASAAAAAGLYASVLAVNINTVLTVSEGGFLISVDTSSGDIDITLPDSASLSADFRVAVVKNTTDSNVINVKRAGSDTINGGASDIVQGSANSIFDYVLDQSIAAYIANVADTSTLTAPLDTNGFSINESEGASVASAAQPNIWAGDGDTLHMTGATQVDDFTDAPRIGARVTIIVDNGFLLKNGLGITLPGGQDITTESGDSFDVYADGAVDTFKVMRFERGGATSFTSSDQSITSAGLLTLAHGMGAIPQNVTVFLRCTTANVNYLVNDVIRATMQMSSMTAENKGCAVRIDATNVYIRFGAAGNPFNQLNNTTGVSQDLTKTSWSLYVEASL